MNATTTVRNVCRICAVGCGTLVEIERHDGRERVVHVAGDPDDPWSAGYTCSKGRAGPQFHHHVDRLDHPLVRGLDRAQPLTRAGWSGALDDVAERLRAIVEEHGPSAVAHYTGTGGPLDPAGYVVAQSFFRRLGTDQAYSALSVDCAGKYLVPELIAGVQLLFQPDLARTDLLIAIGVNTAVSHGHGLMMANPIVRLRELRARGGRFVVVDPRRSESARHADLHLAPRPGTDHVLLACVVRDVLARGGDAAFLDCCADPVSVERLRLLVDPYDPVSAAAICDVDPVGIVDVLRLVEAAGRVSIETGTGVSMNRAANLTEWMAWALAVVTGSLDRPRGVTFNPGFLRPLEDALPGGRGDLGTRPRSRPDLPRLVNGEIPCAALADEIEAGHVRALVVRAGNPALAIPGDDRLRAALARLELLVVIDVRPTETTAVATHVFPMTDHFERGDLVTGYLQAAPFLRWAPAVVEPMAERRPQWFVFTELARRLGLPVLAGVAGVAGDGELGDERVAIAISARARHSFSDVAASPAGIRDDSLAPGWLIPNRLPRLLDLAPEALCEQLAAHRPLGAPASLVLVNRRVGRRYNSLGDYSRRQDGAPGAPTLSMHPDDAAARGLVAGAEVVVTTMHGSCTATVDTTASIRPGVVSLPHGFGSVNVNRLTSTDDTHELNGMPVLSGYAVGVTAAR